jgi:hypothetical protein
MVGVRWQVIMSWPRFLERLLGRARCPPPVNSGFRSFTGGVAWSGAVVQVARMRGEQSRTRAPRPGAPLATLRHSVTPRFARRPSRAGGSNPSAQRWRESVANPYQLRQSLWRIGKIGHHTGPPCRHQFYLEWTENDRRLIRCEYCGASAFEYRRPRMIFTRRG